MTVSEPLWQVMHHAQLQELADNPHAELAEIYQSMIRAIAGELFERFPDEVGVFRWILSEVDRTERKED